jgi:hypothetical protein
MLKRNSNHSPRFGGVATISSGGQDTHNSSSSQIIKELVAGSVTDESQSAWGVL